MGLQTVARAEMFQGWPSSLSSCRLRESYVLFSTWASSAFFTTSWLQGSRLTCQFKVPHESVLVEQGGIEPPFLL